MCLFFFNLLRLRCSFPCACVLLLYVCVVLLPFLLLYACAVLLPCACVLLLYACVVLLPFLLLYACVVLLPCACVLLPCACVLLLYAPPLPCACVQLPYAPLLPCACVTASLSVRAHLYLIIHSIISSFTRYGLLYALSVGFLHLHLLIYHFSVHASINILQHLNYFCCNMQQYGVFHLSRLLQMLSAPFSINNWTIFKYPFRTAIPSGVNEIPDLSCLHY